jgi:hypothetical protein
MPESRSGPTSLANLALACYGCQLHKLAFEFAVDPNSETSTQIFNPRRQRWTRHFKWSKDGVHLEGRTRVGRATVERLAMNHPRQIEARLRWKAHPDLFP